MSETREQLVRIVIEGTFRWYEGFSEAEFLEEIEEYGLKEMLDQRIISVEIMREEAR